ncbi:MAG TPA: ABC transporter ATP-binding protein [Anaerolineales bacterium]|nr:ABC transporter ATP-binding protein [Anaerolineales bacterium]
MSAKIMIETHDLTRVYGDGEEIRALDGVNLVIEAGEFMAVMGPSGSGKSTLLNIFGALDLPTSGQVWVNGQDLANLRDADGFRAKSVGFMFQLHNLLPTLTARENVEIPMTGYLGAKARRQRAEELLALVGLGERMNHLPGQLSGGQRQRVAAARALANQPPLVLADEPTGSLDTSAGQDLMALLKELNHSQGVTFVIVTHDPAVARQTRRVVVMADGKIAREDRIGSPLEEDLKMWRHSNLGQQIFAGDHTGLQALGISDHQIGDVKAVLKLANGDTSAG